MNKQTNGVSKLNDDMEQFRMTVVEMELQARYTKAQWEYRHYAIETDKLKVAFNELVEKEKKAREEAEKRFQEIMAKEGVNIEQPQLVTEDAR
jgi:hypothetical protein